ncbi:MULTISPECIES: bifunctional phosphoribosyl-AMP cyclohydrolase/phosphoribosyl-ATP diphosphatase HisIE [Brevibacillus]|jgi:phosphoribosyl-ATP pyrophosphohydrolase/phosphoribosyl-AMP cyclohydrolase|uniref:Histidine biosynthesis bifunctional protein HisIE n=1 Tax=Brevibacillus parabrevis TaxID=54914 RepID=A0A4Y3PQH8_BREPA|nr:MULTISPECIES: bifunctional phosphoribosyl-AMP cyclohydrolase/phosphoribosyl-ATP diphosphatase HisIE [Brevibacillus]TGV29572.1 bifunctional phosphoribosyl-AMP cyclohydrolase/phosphoribosyl-ATP diphosphatase HisIE [Mesorhizobium sp. M00.F.Ca.ET.186.01.1.1]MBU8713733.1 bifunctional phosphoribosyl-AMP cyclohydrolase/phosphoribosyl-ATP diphosphatase HisIE [Brevibacillus parabrevis]MDH6350809.1 phosphoribosyl-ATP pyrophosphohydrolase/phosphoribosyl-AMP cyclohydrolase [Brevibacillus sp. 1238]MDR499
MTVELALAAQKLRFDENGLIPVIVQDAQSKAVLTLAYMNEESFLRSVETKETWFWSRSRQELWHKGATSGNTQRIVSMQVDCDSDALVVQVVPNGPACHTGAYSCFSGELLAGEKELEKGEAGERFAILGELEELIAKREAERPEGSYTTYLFEKGVDKILKKVGEEAAEVIIAAKNRSHEELRYEASDLLFHLLVLLREQKLPLDDVLAELRGRR